MLEEGALLESWAEGCRLRVEVGIGLVIRGRGGGDEGGCWIEEGEDSEERWSGMVGMRML